MLTPAMRAIPQPCLCLWRGFWQITKTAPPRRMILHFSHIGFTDARTFIALEFVSKKETRRSQELDRGREKRPHGRPGRIARRSRQACLRTPGAVRCDSAWLRTDPARADFVKP